MIDGVTRDFLNDFLRRTAIRERAEIVAIAILQTHVHVLVRSGHGSISRVSCSS
jgi:REP element-mobilizing transposase RayT